MFQLMILDSRGGQSRRVALTEGAAVSIGSSVDCELVLPGGEVAPHHGQLEPDGTSWRFVAAGSATSALLNGQQVQSADLRAGDVLTIGPYRLVLTPAPGGHARAPAAATHAAAPPPPEPMSAPAPGRVAGARHHAGGASHREARHAGAATGSELRTHSLRGGTNKKNDGAKTVAIVIAVLVIGFSVYFFGSGKPWQDLEDTMRVEFLDVRKRISVCDFDGASRKVNELLAMSKDTSSTNKVLDVKAEVDKARANFEKGRLEFEALRNSGLDPRTLQDKLKMFAYENRAFPPLAEAADQLWTNINANLRASAAAPRAPPPPKKAPDPDDE